MTEARRTRRAGGRHDIPIVEWIVGAIGFVIVVSLIVFLTREAMRPQSPPELVVRVDSSGRRGTTHVVYFTVSNRGRATAADVGVRGSIRRETLILESSAALLDYVPGESASNGALIFTHGGAAGRALELSITGYRDP
jgi:uncharacterized protein (TIGR02588 family)